MRPTSSSRWPAREIEILDTASPRQAVLFHLGVDGRVVDEDVHTAALMHDRAPRRCDRVLVGHVELAGRYAAGIGVAPEFTRCFLGALEIDVREINVGAEIGEGRRVARPKQARAAGHDSGLAGEIEDCGERGDGFNSSLGRHRRR